MYDIVFLSYNESIAESNWEALKARFPRAMRCDGVSGIAAAHKAAARMANTQYFWVVDADNRIEDDFDFSLVYKKPNLPPEDTVSVWRCRNNANDLVYGYGVSNFSRVMRFYKPVMIFWTSRLQLARPLGLWTRSHLLQ